MPRDNLTDEQRAKWRASVLRTNNKPSTGAGYGGPAKGAGNGAEPFVLGPEQAANGVPAGQGRKARRFERANEYLESVLDDPADQRTGIQAAMALGTLNKDDQPNTIVNVAALVDRPARETHDEWVARRQRELTDHGRILGTPAGTAD
jgi:hypothetical protein